MGDLREKVAKALHDQHWSGKPSVGSDWSKEPDHIRVRWLRQADAAFLTIQAAGFKAVPVEPTEEMHTAARDWSIRKYGQGIGSDGEKR
jgi:hypothetical protein